ncbi:MAG: UbiA family prenyltransferase [Gaiellaceae bacterium]
MTRGAAFKRATGAADIEHMVERAVQVGYLEAVEPLPAPLERRTGGLRALVRAARPHQWTKNLLLFAGILFAAKLGDLARWVDAVSVFAAYCAASSAAYLVNDVRDRELDAAHPLKRFRPIASGELSPRSALVAAGVLAAVALALGALVSPLSLLLLVAFAGMQAAYSLAVKHVVLLDVFAIAGLFVTRAAAGAIAVDVRLSPWLVLCTGLLALFLALAKRRGELVQTGGTESAGRPVLAGYSLALVDQLVSIAAASAICSYSIYTFTATDSPAMMATIPFVVFGLFRYLFLVQQRSLGEEPERVLITDVPILATIACWGIAAAAILAFV